MDTKRQKLTNNSLNPSEENCLFLALITSKNQQKLKASFPILQSIPSLNTAHFILFSSSKIFIHIPLFSKDNPTLSVHNFPSQVSVKRHHETWIMRYKGYPVSQISLQEPLFKIDINHHKISRYLIEP